ncbi:conserved hypothetical protein [Xanthomonas oryzae pv. oryzae MAFF 311018]|nr:conserved hypothetical protein [Xanthomonas oryzae pv. oryzae MAFF 311018]
MQGMVVNHIVTSVYTVKQFEANANGTLFELPAGAASLAAGISYRKERSTTTSDPLWTGDENGLCGVIEFCSSTLSGCFDVKDAYAEALFPLLKDLTGINALNVTVGTRFSDYSSVGSKTNSKVALE